MPLPVTWPQEVTPTLKPDPAPCSCGCQKVGRPRARAWRDGLAPHVRACRCRRCTGSRQGRNAGKRERRIAKDLGGQRQALSGALSGADVVTALGLRIEETANKALVAGLRSWWTGKGTQAKVSRLMAARGATARIFVTSWDGRRQLAVMPYTDLVALVSLIRRDLAEEME